MSIRSGSFLLSVAWKGKPILIDGTISTNQRLDQGKFAALPQGHLMPGVSLVCHKVGEVLLAPSAQRWGAAKHPQMPRTGLTTENDLVQKVKCQG